MAPTGGSKLNAEIVRKTLGTVFFPARFMIGMLQHATSSRCSDDTQAGINPNCRISGGRRSPRFLFIGNRRPKSNLLSSNTDLHASPADALNVNFVKRYVNIAPSTRCVPFNAQNISVQDAPVTRFSLHSRFIARILCLDAIFILNGRRSKMSAFPRNTSFRVIFSLTYKTTRAPVDIQQISMDLYRSAH